MRGLVMLGLVAAVAGRAAADDPKAGAKQHIEKATAFHQHRHWREALDELNIAYTLDPQPDLLYAIAQLHVALGACAEAITFYERFIASKPTAQREAVARKAIAICKTNPPPPEPGPDDEPKPVPVVEPRPVRVVTPPAPPPVATSAPWYRDTAGDVLVGSGVVAGGVALVLYRSALSDLDASNTAATYPEQSDLYDHAKTSRTFAVVAGVGAGALVAAGLIHYLVHDDGEHGGVAIAPAHGGGVVTWSGGF